MSARTWPRRLITFGYRVVALEFLVGAITKYWPGMGPLGSDYAVKFVHWGYPSWFRFVVGTIELVCAAMLLVPGKRLRFVGAVGLVLVLDGAVTTHIVNHDPLSESLAAPTHLLIAAVIALANWPAHWKDLLRPTATSSRPATAVPETVRATATPAR